MLINTPEEMFKLWQELSKKYKILLLFGDLWAWKTLLTKWFANWLWIDENVVQSPTYAYINSYDWKLLHVDMYRIGEENDVWEKWINDQISKHEYIAIEWPKFIEPLIPARHLEVSIKRTGDNEREIVVSDPRGFYQDLIKSLEVK